MSDSYSLPTEPEGMVATLVERFNSGKVSAMMSLYAPEAVFIAKDGRTITDHTEIAAQLKHVHLGGSASDILRRGADGRWRYLIDNNQGTAVRQRA
jgi:ketosteroid isomerase-like protein